jgi:2-dehydro-3-deoxyphosphogluconate aldolase/(4S)-4-hydroxy-2-oxoglutarate aldolase
MARHARLDVYRSILDTKLVATFHDERAATAESIANALLEGGVRVLEFLARSDAALGVFRETIRRVRTQSGPGGGAIFGVGSIVDPATAALYLAEGADFVVSPLLDPAVVGLCHRHQVAILPGCGTVTEVANAQALGVEIVKLFPSSAFDGAEFIRSLHGPMPWSRVLPTGNGVQFSRESVERWLAAGACALGTGGALVRPEDVAAGKFAEITARAKQMRGWIAEAKS